MHIEQLLKESKWMNRIYDILYEFKNETLKINHLVIGRCEVINSEGSKHIIKADNYQFEMDINDLQIIVNDGKNPFELNLIIDEY